MADIADVANDYLEAIEAAEISRLRELSARPGVPPTGFCLYCDESCGTKRWCNATCRDEWETERKRSCAT